jgi:hypothetical protein
MPFNADGTIDRDAQAIIANLSAKLASLTQSSIELVQAYAEGDNNERISLKAQLTATSFEQMACQQRIQDLMALQAYKRPGTAEETALLAAMQAVGALVNTTAAINAVITASDNLIKAYTAKSTQA